VCHRRRRIVAFAPCQCLVPGGHQITNDKDATCPSCIKGFPDERKSRIAPYSWLPPEKIEPVPSRPPEHPQLTPPREAA
jgi:hypothetical protein